jgi:IS5 family transposase
METQMQIKQSQKIADEIDCELYRLYSRLEGLIDSDQMRSQQWAEAQQAIDSARRRVRELMDEKRRAETLGS